MEILVLCLKYGFVVALAIEGLLIGRALFSLAAEKARAAAAPVAQE